MVFMKKIIVIALILLLSGCVDSQFDPFPKESRTSEFAKYNILYEAYDQGMVYAYSYVEEFSFLKENGVPNPDFIYLFTGADRDGIEFVLNCDTDDVEIDSYCQVLTELDVDGCPYVDFYGEPIIFDGRLQYISPYYFSATGKGIDRAGEKVDITFRFYITPFGFIVLNDIDELDDVDPFSPGYEYTGESEPRDTTKEFTLDDKNFELAWNGFDTGIPNFIPNENPRFKVKTQDSK